MSKIKVRLKANNKLGRVDKEDYDPELMEIVPEGPVQKVATSGVIPAAGSIAGGVPAYLGSFGNPRVAGFGAMVGGHAAEPIQESLKIMSGLPTRLETGKGLGLSEQAGRAGGRATLGMLGAGIANKLDYLTGRIPKVGPTVKKKKGKQLEKYAKKYSTSATKARKPSLQIADEIENLKGSKSDPKAIKAYDKYLKNLKTKTKGKTGPTLKQVNTWKKETRNLSKSTTNENEATAYRDLSTLFKNLENQYARFIEGVHKMSQPKIPLTDIEMPGFKGQVPSRFEQLKSSYGDLSRGIQQGRGARRQLGRRAWWLIPGAIGSKVLYDLMNRIGM